MPPSLIGSRADLLIEIVVALTVLTLPILAVAIQAARRGDYRRHRAIQLGLTIVFIVATIALEIDIRMAGGMEHFVRGGAYEGTRVLWWILYGHLAVAALNALLWGGVPWMSFRRYGSTLPGTFSSLHRKAGKLAALTCVLTAVSGVVLYVVGFVL